MARQMQFTLWIFTFILGLSLLPTLKAQNASQNSNTAVVYPAWLNSSQTQYNQFLADKYNYFVTPLGNKVWVCGMSLAWNQLKREILNGQNATFQGFNPLQQKIVDNLNSQQFKKSELSDDSYYIASGFGSSTIDRINFQVRQKFPTMTFLPMEFKLQETDFISYAYVFKQVAFETPFTKKSRFLFNDNYVQGFEASSSKLKNQVYYKYYNDQDNFMVGLETKNPNEEILMWKTYQAGLNDEKFDKIISMINFYNQLPSIKLTRSDRFSMPAVDFEFERTYHQIVKSKFTNPGYDKYQIGQMKQNLKVKVTNTGVTMENQAVVIGFRSALYYEKSFILDSNFWLIMKEKNKMPYLVMLVSEVSQNAKI